MLAPADHDVDLEAIRRVEPFVAPLRHYFRYEARGMHNIPDGHQLMVANHSGGKLPIDMFLFAQAWHRHFYFKRPFRILTHDIFFRHSSFIAQCCKRIGFVPAGRENCARLFDRNESVLVLPGGDHETYRPYRERYRIDFGGRTGFAELALINRVPITPIVTIGSHELFFILTRGERLAKWFGMKKFFRYSCWPITLGFPFGLYFGPIPSPLPLPAKITTEVLEPIELWKHFSVADIPKHRAQMARLVVDKMQAAMDRLASERRLPVVG